MEHFLLCNTVLRLTASSLSSAKLLYDIRTKYKDAPVAIATIGFQAAHITKSLSYVQAILAQNLDLAPLPDSQPELTHAIDILLTGCTVVFGCLDEELRNSMDGQLQINIMTGKKEAGWNLDRIEILLNAVRSHQNSIKMLIPLLSLKSIQDITQILNKNQAVLKNTVQTIDFLKDSYPRLYFPLSIFSKHDRQSFHPDVPKNLGPLMPEAKYDEVAINGKPYLLVPQDSMSKSLVKKSENPKTIKDASQSSQASNTTQNAKTTHRVNSWVESYPRHNVALQDIWAYVEAQAAMQNKVHPPNLIRLGFSDSSITNSKEAKEVVKIGGYVLGGSLGRTPHSKIRRGWKSGDHNRYAIKQIIRQHPQQPDPHTESWTEISILSDLGRNFPHRNIVAFHEIVMTSFSFAMVFKNFESGNLYEHMRSSGALTEKAAKLMFRQLLSGLEHIHQKGIVHRKLTLTNLLLDNEGAIIITGFDEAKRIKPEEVLGPLDERIYYGLTNKSDHVLDNPPTYNLGDADLIEANYRCETYGAPEILVSKIYGGRKADLWSCGVILFAMLAGEWPQHDPAANPQHVNILLYNWIHTSNLEFPLQISGMSANLIKRLLIPYPWRRITLEETLRHVWLQ